MIRDRRPTILVGATGVAGTFTEAVIDAMVERVGPADRPIVLPLSNPTSASEATPADVLAWSQGRAIVATGSPFDAVTLDGVRHEIGQANNAFIFPGVGLGAIVAETRAITDRMFLLAARTLAAAVTDERIASDALYPPISSLRAVSREIAITVVREAIESGVAGRTSRPMAWPRRSMRRPGGPRTSRMSRSGSSNDGARTRHEHARASSRPRGDRRGRRRSSRSSWPSRGPERCASACWRPGSATPTCTSATASGPARHRWRWATRGRASSRRSGRAWRRCGSASRSHCRGWCRAGRAGRAGPAGRGPAPTRPRSGTGSRTARRRCTERTVRRPEAARPARRCCPTAASRRCPRRRSCRRRPRSDP